MPLSQKSAPSTIVLKGMAGTYGEGVAAVATTPGKLVELASTGKLALAAATTRLLCVAREDDIQGKGIEDDYAVDNNMLVYYPLPGDEVYLILKDQEIAAVGSKLQVDASGEVSVGTTNRVVGQALEANDTQADSTTTPVADRRIRVRIL